jgi:hypothetical protein
MLGLLRQDTISGYFARLLCAKHGMFADIVGGGEVIHAAEATVT